MFLKALRFNSDSSRRVVWIVGGRCFHNLSRFVKVIHSHFFSAESAGSSPSAPSRILTVAPARRNARVSS